MMTKLIAVILALTFVIFVNLAAAVTASFNRIETSAIASIASVFQVLIDLGAVVVVIGLLIRWFMKLAWDQQNQSRKPVYRPAVKAVNPSPQNGWNYSTPAPLPFEEHVPAAYADQNTLPPGATNIPLTPGILADNVHRMRQQRSGYRMVR